MSGSPNDYNANDFFTRLIQGAESIFSPEGKRQAQGFKIAAPIASSNDLNAENLNAIIQKNSKGFKVIDILPQYLDPVNYPVQLDPIKITNIIGPEGVSAGAGLFEDSSANNPTLPYWRTIPVNQPGNFVQIEFLPVRLNDSVSGYSPSLFPQVQDSSFRTDNSDSFTDFSPKHSSDNLIFINFGDTSDTPQIARHGRIFKTEFANFFLTLKCISCPIRITIGYNSEIVDLDRMDFNSKLAYAPGKGIFSDSSAHATPFCITDRDLNGIQNTNSNDYSWLMANGEDSEDIITNRPNTVNRCYKSGAANTDYQLKQYNTLYQYNNDNTAAACAVDGGTWVANDFNINGMSLLWITGFNVSLWPNGSSQPVSAYDIGLEIWQYNGLSAPTPIKRILNASMMTGANASAVNPTNVVVNLTDQPMRVCLLTNQALRIRATGHTAASGTAASAFIKFSVLGYSWGPIAGLGTKSGFAVCPFQTKMKLTENPYAIDQSWAGAPAY